MQPTKKKKETLKKGETMNSTEYNLTSARWPRTTKKKNETCCREKERGNKERENNEQHRI